MGDVLGLFVHNGPRGGMWMSFQRVMRYAHVT